MSHYTLRLPNEGDDVAEHPFNARHSWSKLTTDTDTVCRVAGLTRRDLAYFNSQSGLGTEATPLTPRPWRALPVGQAVLYGMLHHHTEDVTAFRACRGLRDVVADDDLDALSGYFLVIRGTTVAFVHHPEELPDYGAVALVVDLDDVLAKVAEVQS